MVDNVSSKITPIQLCFFLYILLKINKIIYRGDFAPIYFIYNIILYYTEKYRKCYIFTLKIKKVIYLLYFYNIEEFYYKYIYWNKYISIINFIYLDENIKEKIRLS